VLSSPIDRLAPDYWHQFCNLSLAYCLVALDVVEVRVALVLSIFIDDANSIGKGRDIIAGSSITGGWEMPRARRSRPQTSKSARESRAITSASYLISSF
jgi:hypothetical protein